MPELPEVETTRRGIEPHVVGKTIGRLIVRDPRLRWPVPPSTSPEDPAFQPRRYWRGPTWPVITWLFWWALNRIGETDRAERLRAAALDQLRVIDFAEYVEPFTGEPLGSLDQSWTAAVALDYLATPDGG